MYVDILGTEYEVIIETLEQNSAFNDCDGYCDPSVKKNIYQTIYRTRMQG